MTKIDIFSGFLGAGKTTLIKKLIKEAYSGEKLVLIENEFGEIGIDGGFLQDAGINITEMNSGCICCSLVGDFNRALIKVLDELAPDRILIEPSGVGKLSDVIRAVRDVGSDRLVLSGFVTVVDAAKCRMHMKNFGEFFNDQIENAGTIVLSHTAKLTEEKLAAAIAALREHNESAVIVSTDWDALSGAQLLAAMERSDTLAAELERLKKEEICPVCGHSHHHEHGHHDDHEHEHHHEHDEHCDCHGHHEHHHEHDEHCDCHGHHEHHHEHDEHCDCHGHHEHHHEHDEHCDCHEHHEHHHEHDGHCDCHEHHEHHHEHDEHCDCGCHSHGHHHHHHADEVFVSFGAETAKQFDSEALKAALCALENTELYGAVLRAKGIVAGKDGSWIHFDYVPGEPDVRSGSAAIIGRLCVIGSGLDREALSALFGVALK
ncbi:MAG: GTP-binding protein [Ruminococcaceae bacterium]|nr:GTP-binding protein [Oscillospiraceae bacterium]